jgi:hypothetical protein
VAPAGGGGKKEPYVASGTPDWPKIIKEEHLEVVEPTERSRRGRRRVKDNWLAERFGPKEHTLDRELGLERLPMYGDPDVPRGERDPVRYNPVDEGGKHQAALEQTVGPRPLLTVQQWKNLVNPNHVKGWVEFRMNCSAVTRAVVDIIQGRRIRIADGDFQKSPLDHKTPRPGDYDDTYEWMGVRGPAYRMDRHLPPGHPDPFAHQLAFTKNAYHSVEAGLKDRPPGTVAAICVRWAPDGGHWFAAYVDPHGKVRHLDAQPAPAAIDLPWPPVYDGLLDRLEYTIREPDGDWEGANSADPQSTW